MRFFERAGYGLRCRSLGETLEIVPWGEHCLRVRAAMQGDVTDSRWALLDAEKTENVEIQLAEDSAFIRCGDLVARINVDGWRLMPRISYFTKEGKLLLRETDAGGALNLKARHFSPRLGGDHRLEVTFEGQEDEQLYGMGQYQQEELDLKHCTLELAHRNSQASVPFVMSSRGYGFVWHDPAVGQVSFSKNRTTWRAESTKQMDYLIFCGGTPKDLSRIYARLTGFAPMMPEHGLGFWQCKLRYWNQEQLLSVAREYKRRQLPVDVIVCDFFHWPKMGDFRFDPECFPDPKAMCDELREMGIALMVSVWPQVDLESENYEEMRQQGLLVRSEMGEQIGMRFCGRDSMFFDATNPRAREYVWEKCRKNYYDMGVRAFWLDEAEPEFGVYDFANYRYFAGAALQTSNLYPQSFSRAFYEGMAQEGQEPSVNLVRCAWLGSQRYGALVWSGDIHCDWETFRRQLCAGLNMGIAGIPWWTTDIGGFSGGDPDDPAFRELLIRWFQWGAYCPAMRLHGDRKPLNTGVVSASGRPLLFSGGENEVWSFGEEAYPILVKYMCRREKMREYTRSVMAQTHETGMPVMRAMFYEFPKDPRCVGLKDQYMFGDRYLVAPVMTPGAVSRSVYLPAGKWRNVDSGDVLSGEQTITADAPLCILPVFERLDS